MDVSGKFETDNARRVKMLGTKCHGPARDPQYGLYISDKDALSDMLRLHYQHGRLQSVS